MNLPAAPEEAAGAAAAEGCRRQQGAAAGCSREQPQHCPHGGTALFDLGYSSEARERAALLCAGTNFSFEEREERHLDGLLPPVHESTELQAER